VHAALLVVLLRHGEGYGLQLIDRIRDDAGGHLVFAQGVLYPALRRLEQEGLVKSRTSDALPERGGRPRIYYKLTPAGQRVARETLSVLSGLIGLGIRHAT
jgi:PadR family transcriptional regulator, regulatory protein PadR